MQTSKKPWEIKSEWMSGKISSTSMTRKMVLGIYIILLNILLCSGLPYEAISKGEFGQISAKQLAMIGLAAITLAFLILVMRWILQLFKYGIPVYEMAPLPARLGKKLAGAIYISRRVDFPKGICLSLECVKWAQSKYSLKSDGRSKEKEKRQSIWIKSVELSPADLQSVDNKTQIKIDFEVPPDLPQTSLRRGHPTYEWLLTIKAKSRGVNLYEAFEIPVLAPDLESQAEAIQ